MVLVDEDNTVNGQNRSTASVSGSFRPSVSPSVRQSLWWKSSPQTLSKSLPGPRQWPILGFHTVFEVNNGRTMSQVPSYPLVARQFHMLLCGLSLNRGAKVGTGAITDCVFSSSCVFAQCYLILTVSSVKTHISEWKMRACDAFTGNLNVWALTLESNIIGFWLCSAVNGWSHPTVNAGCGEIHAVKS